MYTFRDKGERFASTESIPSPALDHFVGIPKALIPAMGGSNKRPASNKAGLGNRYRIISLFYIREERTRYL
jgi:hypothetical protein